MFHNRCIVKQHCLAASRTPSRPPRHWAPGGKVALAQCPSLVQWIQRMGPRTNKENHRLTSRQADIESMCDWLGTDVKVKLNRFHAQSSESLIPMGGSCAAVSAPSRNRFVSNPVQTCHDKSCRMSFGPWHSDHSALTLWRPEMVKAQRHAGQIRAVSR